MHTAIHLAPPGCVKTLNFKKQTSSEPLKTKLLKLWACQETWRRWHRSTAEGSEILHKNKDLPYFYD